MGRKGPLKGHFSRSRSLADLNAKLGMDMVQKTIRRFLSRGNVRVLEIGCGEGRVLMELRKLFPDIELHGINKKPWQAMKGASSLRGTATRYKIFKPNDLKNVRLPKIHFCNARKLDFKDNYFDLVISQVSVQYVDRKDWLLEEVWRVLKKDGQAFLHIDTRPANLPDFLDFETPRFIIYKKGKVFPVKRLVDGLRKKGYDISYKTFTEKEKGEIKKRIIILMRKNTQKRMKLNLKYVNTSSFDIGRINLEKDQWTIYWGYRSVYRI